MKIEIMKECGYEEALVGLSLSYNRGIDKMPSVANKLYSKNGGHNKFLESIDVWMDVAAPRYWWQQFDAYRIGITKQSESTMHTIMNRELKQSDFCANIPECFIDVLNQEIKRKNFKAVKLLLPESFLQRRIVKANYKSLRNIATQRYSHKLVEWRYFVWYLVTNLEHAEFFSDILLNFSGWDND